jgi:hypothetical protein
MTQGDGRVSLSLVTKTSSGCRGYFDLMGTIKRLLYTDYVRYMVGDHARIERGKCVAC